MRGGREGIDCAVCLFSETLNPEHFAFTSERSNNSIGYYYPCVAGEFGIISNYSLIFCFSPGSSLFFTSLLLPNQAARPVNSHHIRGQIIQGKRQKKRKERIFWHSILKVPCSYKTQKDLGHRLNV